MCGLAYKHSFDGSPVNEWVFDTYTAQRDRGHDGFGLFNGVHLVHAAMEERIINWLSKGTNKSSLLMFHHRWPTSTINVKKAAHPFTTRKYFGDSEYVMVHNGVIRNSLSRHTEHKKSGIKYQSSLKNGKFNDSEALLWDFALWQEGKLKEIEVVGDVAFICMKLTKGKLDKLFYYRNTARPLHILKDKGSLSLASEGEGDMVKFDELNTFSYGNHHTYKEQLHISYYEYNGGYATNNSKPHDSRWWDEMIETGGTPKQVELLSGGKWSDDIPHYRETPDHLRMSKKERRKLKKAITKRYAELERKSGMSSAQVDSVFDKDEPTTAQVQHTSLLYLEGSRGLFDDAYWQVEQDYLNLLEQDEYGPDYEYDKHLLERVMAFIENDPEHIDHTSMSSMYINLVLEEEGSLWQYA